MQKITQYSSVARIMSQTNTSDALSFIARTFAGAYYGLLVDAENFSKLHTFYQLDAVFTRGDEATGQDDASTTTGLEVTLIFQLLDFLNT